MDKRWDKNKNLKEPYGAERYSVKSCGKRHGFCKVCRPDIAESIKNTQRHNKNQVGLADATSHLAPGYIPHPTKTMWERHAEMYNIDPQLHTQPYLHVGSLKSLREQKEEIKKVVQESKLKEGEQYSDYELSRIFGFDRRTIIAFREGERQAKKDALYEEKRKKREEKRAIMQPREIQIVELRIEQQKTLQEIGEITGLTRERVRQILVNVEKKAKVTFPKFVNGGGKGMTKLKEDIVPITIAVHCKVCGKIMEIPERKYDVEKLYSCKEHKLTVRNLHRFEQNPKWFELDGNARNKWLYENDPNYKRTRSEGMKRHWKKLKQDPVKWAKHREREKAYLQKYFAKKKAAKVRPFIETDGQEI